MGAFARLGMAFSIPRAAPGPVYSGPVKRTRMRLAVLGDIHGNLTALEAAWADVQGRGEFDEVWVPGDLAAFGAAAGGLRAPRPRAAQCAR